MIEITRESFRRFAPKAKPAYVKAMFDGMEHLAKAGILDSKERWAAFIGQCATETDGCTILRESLDYRTVRAVRNAWPARAKKHDDEWIAANLLHNPVALGDWAYGGREGNRKGTSDGYDFRGGMWLQTTHRNATEAYCKKLGIPFVNDVLSHVLDDPSITLRFAVLEWTEGNCNAYADKGDVLSISKIINTGSAKSGVMPNGLDRRRQETARALDIWSDATDVVASIVSTQTRPFPETESPSAVQVAASSKSVWALIAAAGAKAIEKLEGAFNWLPEIQTEVDSILAPLSSIAGHLKLNIEMIAATIVIGCIIIVICRHTKDKQELKALKGE